MPQEQASSYIAKHVDENGLVAYTDDENAVWRELITRQHAVIQHRACDEFMHGLELLNLPQDRVPQCNEVSAVLRDITGWALEPVPAMISFEQFFMLLASRRFPAATFIRRKEELDYLKEPDIFHEIYGHCPLLTNPAYAEFAQTYGKLGLNASEVERIWLARLFWFTIEFGLIDTPNGLRAYGGGILSSINETVYCLESETPVRKPFELLDVLRTPYRTDAIQPIYFIINDFEQLFDLIHINLMSAIKKASDLGEYIPAYPC